MTVHDIVVLGLPGSGKTTFLAALWHLLTSDEVETRLSLVSLKAGESAHLNEIAASWRRAKVQERTLHAGDRTVTMSLRNGAAPEFQLSFPDLAGESFQQMWEARECAPEVAASLRSANVLLFIHADKIKAPGWIADDAEDAEAVGLPQEPGKPVPWNARMAPTQVKVVDLLQSLQAPPLETGARSVAIVLSAWDRAAGAGMSPDDYLTAYLPLLRQYLSHGLDKAWTVRVFGVSAQGGVYDETGKPPKEEAQRIREMDVPSERITVVSAEGQSHDLTEPLQWLLA
ncbi:TRAFAC clade GTPase domain-containing protein [Roseateles sp. 22389]|uniref:TRAFAC clade GTPase domain-containing protein n=1 Tax=Roseateles sp. 22389 TaxID=3453916 RepID=UPI003F828293